MKAAEVLFKDVKDNGKYLRGFNEFLMMMCLLNFDMFVSIYFYFTFFIKIYNSILIIICIKIFYIINFTNFKILFSKYNYFLSFF